MFLPAAWERFRDHLPTADHNDLIAGYARLVSAPDPALREAATDAWIAWEDAVIAHESSGVPGAYGRRPRQAQLALVRICTHYFAHGAFLEEGVLLRDAHRLTGIPTALPGPGRGPLVRRRQELRLR
jgi:proline iminopeptidase